MARRSRTPGRNGPSQNPERVTSYSSVPEEPLHGQLFRYIFAIVETVAPA